MADHYTKVLLTIIALCLIGLVMKDAWLEPVVSAQFQGWEEEASMPGRDSFALSAANGYAYLCVARLLPNSFAASGGRAGFLHNSVMF